MFREDLNHSCKRARSVDCALRPAHDLDPVDIVRGEVGKIECALQTLINRNAVEQNLRVFAAQSTHEHRGQLAGRPGLHHGQARHFAQRIAHALDLFLLEVFRGDHASRLRAIDRAEYRNASLRRRLTPPPLHPAKESASPSCARQTEGAEDEYRDRKKPSVDALLHNKISLTRLFPHGETGPETPCTEQPMNI